MRLRVIPLSDGRGERKPAPFAGRGSPGARGFSLIEMIGVLTVMGILAAVATESVLRRMRLTSQQTEAANLMNIVDALERAVVRTQKVPSGSTWVTAVVDELSLAANRIATNAAGNARLLLVDPAFRVGTTTSSVPPYTQTIYGSTNPVSPRMVLLSSLDLPLPTITNSTAVFSNLWNTAKDAIPAGWSSNWTGRGQDLKIQRVDLQALFHRVVLDNVDELRTAPYSIESTGTVTNVPAGGLREVWFIHNTAFNLHYYPDLASSTTQVLGREYLIQDTGYVFENGRWNRYLVSGPQVTNSFGAMADRFRSKSAPSGALLRATPQAVTDVMCDYLMAMSLHAADGNPTDSAAPPVTPYLRMAYDAQIRLCLVSSNLTK